MATWTISPNTGGATIDNNGIANIPENTGSSSIVYTITCTENGCTTSTTYTVPGGCQSSTCDCNSLTFPSTVGSISDVHNPYYTDNDTDSSSPSYGQPLLILPCEKCSSDEQGSDCFTLPLTASTACTDSYGQLDDFKVETDVSWITYPNSSSDELYSDGIYLEWDGNDCDYNAGPRGRLFRVSDGHIYIKKRSNNQICKTINVTQRANWYIYTGSFQITGNGIDYIKNLYNSDPSMTNAHFTIITEDHTRPTDGRIALTSNTEYNCNNQTTVLDWRPVVTMSFDRTSYSCTVDVPYNMGDMLPSNDPQGSSHICGSNYGCTKDYEDATWRSAVESFCHNGNYQIPSSRISDRKSFARVPERVILEADNFNLWSGSAWFYLTEPTVSDDGYGHYTITYTGGQNGYPTFTISFIADLNALSRDYTIDFNITP